MSKPTTNDTANLVNSFPRKYTKMGIGGAGNIRKSSTIRPVPSVPRLIPSPSTGTFHTGIGGAGNSRSYEERASIPQFERELRSSTRKQNAAGSWYHGIGGAGNRSSSADSRSSESSLESTRSWRLGAERILGMVSGYFRSKRSAAADEKDAY
ncbi:uncharacterized protein L3040_004536 [Drepanopeziza brunnea f. sp. 'multigermtubi']|uniref:Uncharacterized protein n=1 Tax=Marssonina brunnea f. sp. multigermtubi (strain MB_m1) TaxID=1072389 RepID=K1WY91_MARBU|nr:uncharacterized protein MBM_03768 [Drepanopeziza brunnea f. sp. 'multigermtubi' MB_m1]EKD17996.1 hypothetical protein MBM_03768 [Drepanopeziza brunnea f. sp. 'multigermtubi' MB_m1]KAJ5043155.1 hypothetical protein L3040_004536 [Drepanopeziza brunnea f. sp. 'multigermtubi']